MALAHGVDPVDIWMMAVPPLVYSLAFFLLYGASKIRERKSQASQKKRLDELCGLPPA
jgi:hypothetical protein